MSEPLQRPFYARGTLTVARELLGCVLARRLEDGTILRARIVEVEGYIGEDDKACHARAGRTPRTDVMYGSPGVAYVYLTYGMHHLLNAVTEPEGTPAAVLIRAAEPFEGIERMRRTRGTDQDQLLAAGPARLTQAFELDLSHNRTDLRGPVLWIEEGQPYPDRAVGQTPRVGCQTAPPPWDLMPWRFYVTESRFVTPGTRALAAAPSPPAAKKTRGGNRPAHRG